jgi:hypothetical protein
VAAALLTALVAALSIAPVRNMLSPHQAMNRSFDPLHLLNTYGAFGSVGRERYEIVLEGTRDAEPGPNAHWEAYEFPCKPGDLQRRPCVISPYHYRIDWQLWFAAMSEIGDEPWLVRLVWKLLRGDADVKPPAGARSVSGCATALRARRAVALSVHPAGRREQRMVAAHLDARVSATRVARRSRAAARGRGG